MEGKFAFFQMLATGEDGGLLSKGQSLSLTVNGVTELFIDRGRGLHARNSMVSSDSHLEIGRWWSDQRHLDFKCS